MNFSIDWTCSDWVTCWLGKAWLEFRVIQRNTKTSFTNFFIQGFSKPNSWNFFFWCTSHIEHYSQCCILLNHFKLAPKWIVKGLIINNITNIKMRLHKWFVDSDGGLGSTFRSLRQSPICLFTLFDMFFAWFYNPRLVSNIPGCSCDVAYLTL